MMKVKKNDDETLDSFYRGRILVLQKKNGYRFAIDAPLLADFIRTRPSDEILDLGAGNGIVALLLSIKPFGHITAVEIQGTLADLALRNVRLNRLGNKIAVIKEDLRKFRPTKKYDVIFSNPPYIRKTSGFLSVSVEKAVAKHELKCDIYDVMRTTGDLLKKDGRAYFIYPVLRKDDFLKAAQNAGLSVCVFRFVHPRKDEAANLFLTECGLALGEARTLPPLVLHDERGAYLPEARDIFEGRTRDPAF